MEKVRFDFALQNVGGVLAEALLNRRQPTRRIVERHGPLPNPQGFIFPRPQRIFDIAPIMQREIDGALGVDAELRFP